MAIYTNKHTDSISIGRFKVRPGDNVPEVPLTEDEAANLVYFLEKGFLVLQQPEPELAPVVEPEVAPEPEVKKRKRRHADDS